MQYSAILLAAYLLTACQGERGPMGPASSPKTAAELAADTTDCAVTINVIGENIVYQGDNPDTATVTVYDTVAVSPAGGSLSSSGFLWIEIDVDFSDMDWLYARSGWAFYHDSISNAAVRGVYLRKRERFSLGRPELVEWTEFNQFIDQEFEEEEEDERPSYSILDALNEFFISDAQEMLRTRFPDHSYYYVVGLLLAVDPE